MANNFVDEKARWLSFSDSTNDYVMLFVKSWIPFNAWYCNSYPQHGNVDSKCLHNVKNDSNVFKDRLLSLLNNSDAESILFKSHIEDLHNKLERYSIPNSDKKISFKGIYFRDNPIKTTTPVVRKRNLEYKVEYIVSTASNTVSAIIVNVSTTTPVTIYTYSHNKYEYNHFLSDINSKIQSNERRETIERCFKDINPRKKENLIKENKIGSFKIGNTHFINNKDLLSQAIIQILYQLRCVLFHGEIKPNGDNLSIYEPSYHILRILLKSLN